MKSVESPSQSLKNSLGRAKLLGEGVLSGNGRGVGVRVAKRERRMDTQTDRRQRLENLLHLARVARGWSRAKLARAVGRDPTKLVPESGNPKMDYLVALADVLEWPVGDVIEAVWNGSGNGSSREDDACIPGSRSFKSANDELMASHQLGEFRRVVEIAKEMFHLAKTGDERAHASIREAAGWDGLGRYPRVLESARRGLQQGPMSLRLRLALQGTLANAQYTLWDLTPALGTCEVLANWYRDNEPTKAHDFKRVAYVHYVRGNTRRRLMALEPDSLTSHCNGAIADLARAAEMYESLSDELADPNLLGIANTCKGGMLEVEVQQGSRTAENAVGQILDGLDAVIDLESGTMTGDWIESFGWWCIFGSNIALRHLQGRELQQAMAVFTNKAMEIADRLDNWAMRERVFTMQYTLHQSVVDATGLELPYTIDDEDRSLITSTMGRFPNFRPLGWKILETARVVQAL